MGSKLSFRKWLPLVGMAFAAFVFNTSEFMPIGLLTDIASDLGVSEARAGMLISVYAWCVALLSLPLMLLVCQMEMKRLLLGIVALFIVSHVGSALATGYYTLMASRIGVACAHSIFWSIAAPIAVRTVAEGRRALALSVVATGSSIAMVVGLPLGRVIGLLIGWRMTFAIIAVVGTIIFVYLLLTLPQLPSRGSFTVRKMPLLLKNRVLLGIFIMSVLFATSHYTGYGYIEPFLGQVAGMSNEAVTATLILFGASGMLGSWLFSRYYPRNRYRFIGLMASGIAMLLLLLRLSALSVVTVVVLCVLWGLISTAFNVAFQDCTIRYAPADATAVAMSIYSGIFNLGIGTGAFIGGLVCTYSSIANIGYAGGMVAVLTLVYCCCRFFRNMRKADKASTTTC